MAYKNKNDTNMWLIKIKVTLLLKFGSLKNPLHNSRKSPPDLAKSCRTFIKEPTDIVQ